MKKSGNLDPGQYLAHVKSVFEKYGDPETAQGQMKYMRNQFEYYGLKSAVWMDLTREIFREYGLLNGEELKDFARLCLEEDHRELHYAALTMIEKQIRKQPEPFIQFLGELIRTRSWWDTVDWIRKFVGIHFTRFPHLIKPVTEEWMDSGNIWLQRICLIFQLSYREKTDFDLLTSYIRRLSHSKEFFIRKGAGWALRQYAKTDPEAVRQFVEANPQLAPLTKREALKHLKN